MGVSERPLGDFSAQVENPSSYSIHHQLYDSRQATKTLPSRASIPSPGGADPLEMLAEPLAQYEYGHTQCWHGVPHAWLF